ncbi:MAG TPA: hypothetical protein PKA31_02175 [Candidatus Moranbacteria bacterium]|nr:hypothetical protein [Candidatus Moranbacteria bacterium]
MTREKAQTARAVFTGAMFVAGILVIGLVAYGAAREAYRNRKIEREVEALQIEAERVRSHSAQLEQRIKYFESPQFQEMVGKEKLNMRKEGEEVVALRLREQPAAAGQEKGSEEQGVQLEKKSNWQKWRERFFAY